MIMTPFLSSVVIFEHYTTSVAILMISNGVFAHKKYDSDDHEREGMKARERGKRNYGIFSK